MAKQEMLAQVEEGMNWPARDRARVLLSREGAR
jgi:hypothetical protein